MATVLLPVALIIAAIYYFFVKVGKGEVEGEAGRGGEVAKQPRQIRSKTPSQKSTQQRNFKTPFQLILVAAVILVIVRAVAGGGGVVWRTSGDGSTGGGGTSVGVTDPSLSMTAEDLAITADDIVAAYTDYIGETVIFWGPLISKTTSYLMVGSTTSYPVVGSIIRVEPENLDELLWVTVGDEVHIRGQVYGLSDGVVTVKNALIRPFYTCDPRDPKSRPLD